MPKQIGSILIEGVEPQLDGGRYPVKRICGEEVEVRADLLKEGHDALSAVVRWRQLTPAPQSPDWNEAPMRALGNDRWEARFPVAQPGRYAFSIEAWPDPFATWLAELERKLEVRQDVHSELLEGAALLRAVAGRISANPKAVDRLRQAADRISSELPVNAFFVARDGELLQLCAQYPDRSIASRYQELQVIADRPRARMGAWYELFPRSAAGDGRRHGTFKDCEALLPQIQAMGFDVVYLPPIHPIGTTARKGPNNAPNAGPEDVGSPWAIGAASGGHRAVHPSLGSLADFKQFLSSAEKLNLEIALDLAFQCSPDHPYIKEHPEWFSWRPDGTLKTAENPPKRYQDIVNFDFLGPDREALWAELKSVVLFWIETGVRIFRVDNPHTKPLPFWSWLIGEVQAEHPEVIFLAEAFTRPKMMQALAKLGFTQSYTYFTWRNFKREIEEYFAQLTHGPEALYMRGNLWPSTPDILPEFLQQGGIAAFKIRLILAGTLLPSYGIYSGYELGECRAIPNTEEYQNSEKYQLIARDWTQAGNLRAYLTALNAIRRGHPALHHYRNLQFHHVADDQVIFYSKISPDHTDQLLLAVSLDPHAAHPVDLEVPLSELGIGSSDTYQVHELLTGERQLWQGPRARALLTPEQPAAIWTVLRFAHRENSFDYYD
jgi:starch synthase (maltosyl-transferring)